MDGKATVSIHLADTGEFVISRSWDEGEGKNRTYQNQELVFAKFPPESEFKKMFTAGKYKRQGLRGMIEDAGDEEEE